MDAVFIKLLNMSITASWLVLAVILLRFLLKKAPKWIMGVLWGFVAFRLIFPFSLESVFSLIPSAETIPQNILISEKPTINSGFEVLNQAVNPIIADTLTPNVEGSVNPMQIVTFIASVIWIIGIIAMGIYTVVSFIRVRKKVEEAVPLKDNIWVCDHIPTPFILGIFHPHIYIPSSMNETDMEYVIFHEKAHLKRKDHIWKPLGFLLLSVYWFNPILWLAYILLCRDIEFACDEKVIRQFGTEIKKPYSDVLISCSVPRKMISACPLAFGETGVKERVKGVLNYKKPAFWIIIVAIVACIITAVCLLTNPPTNKGSDSNISETNVGGSIKTNDVIINPSGYSLVYHCSSEKDNATLSLEPQSKKFTFTYSLLSSYFAAGTYEEDNEFIVAHSDDGNYKYTFKKDGQNIVFVADKSSEMPSFAYSAGAKAETCVPDGAVFECTDTKDVQSNTNSYFNAEVLEVNEQSILVKPDADSNEIKSADKISVSLNFISTVPVPDFEVGDRVRVIYNGEIAESYPAQINKVFVVYLLSDDGTVLSPTPIK